ncbi:MAG: GH1 family beta-glucosidase [Oscillospiraceae bacterium]|nr:GH1 family beta-glucosidase [Oscillospiraceae bacterium]
MFKKDFVWGAATSAYQIEGAAYADGKGLTIWDTFCKKDGVIFDGHSGDDACEHYYRYKEDVALMKQVGLRAYRLSLSWARILPSGTGAVNPKGIEFYNNLIDELLKNGITPYITLYHWDLPLELYHKGGWLNRESADWFAEYARIAVTNFGDRVKHFMTFNEPQVAVGMGFASGIHAPGLKMAPSETVRMTHNILLAHGKAVKAMREIAPDLKIGIVPVNIFSYPEIETPENIALARKLSFDMIDHPTDWFFSAAWWGDPVMFGKYPEDGLKRFGQWLPDGWERDMETIKQPIDFYGPNFYEGRAVQVSASENNGYTTKRFRYPGCPKTAFNWPITPEGLKWAAIFLHERYKLPIYIMENGLSCHDVISLDGKVHDPNRIDYLNRHLLALREAAESGADVAGYFQWSLLDNFEWASGYSERFGLVYVDFTTQQRIIKDSGHWYRGVIESNGENL